MDSDPEVVLVDKVDEDELSTDKDSGMESAGNSKDDTPERKQTTDEGFSQQQPTKSEPIVSSPAPKPQPVPKAAPIATPAAIKNKDDEYDDEPDESLSERLWGLTEMFPEGVRSFSGAVTDFSVASVKTLYKFTCNASWIFFTSSMILFAPVVFEVERAQMEEMQKTQQKQVLLGPGSAVGGTPGGIPAMPPMAAR
ncbi:mitochondrial import receptor subunit TOM22 homolog [Wyeomyia smithii]|uniref:mitochondrial import receptor subunit TOM22 homolog n=1 Tax=Wyeomyia smithii TaxID=174621 RepID=UPI002467ACD7|nr:mitochondrial import receptor subunit TOM22 homolog [Wyeomyia smithii]XP_055531054.1 mitochondrial import receptor subunit TOM22 homolog [Wyeomyia smithii]